MTDRRPCEDCCGGAPAVAQCRHCMLFYCATCGADPARCTRCFAEDRRPGQHEAEDAP